MHWGCPAFHGDPKKPWQVLGRPFQVAEREIELGLDGE
jgi:hypothetical protein